MGRPIAKERIIERHLLLVQSSCCKKYRLLGYGTGLIKKAYLIAAQFGFSYIRLSVTKGTWQEQWYIRLGFKSIINTKEMKKIKWLEKKLKNYE